MVSFPPVSPPRPYLPPSPHLYAPHAQPISFFLILSPARYWVRSTNCRSRTTLCKSSYASSSPFMFTSCHYRKPVTDLEKPLGIQVVENPRISRQSASEVGNVVSRRQWNPLPHRIYPWLSSPLQVASTPGP